VIYILTIYRTIISKEKGMGKTGAADGEELFTAP
jgi:hypothetical protein